MSFDGSPLQEGAITFEPDADTNGPTAGASIVNGAYSVPAERGLVAGKYKAGVTWSRKTGRQVEVGSPSPPGTLIDEIESLSHTESVTIEKRDHVIDIQLTKK